MVETLLGVGGLDEKGYFIMNTMQMMHGDFNIRNWKGEEELREI